MRLTVIAGMIAVAVFGVGAQAQTPGASPSTAAACPAMPAKLTGVYAPWSDKGDLASATSAADADQHKLVVGKAYAAALKPTPEVKFSKQPGKPGAATTYSGLFSLEIADAATYFIALGEAAWIDLVDKDGKAVESVTHGHGPDCSGIRKFVDFKLSKGAYIIQVSGAAPKAAGILVGKR
jgi:hypothetical protein